MNSAANQPLPLHDIHLPSQVDIWPIAPGWWLLLGTLVLLGMSIWIAYRIKSRHALRRAALIEFKAIESAYADHQDSQRLVSELSILLRRICISRFPHQEVAALTGRAWLHFLNTQNACFSGPLEQLLIQGPYQRQLDGNANALIQACRAWVTRIPPLHSKTPGTQQ